MVAQFFGPASTAWGGGAQFTQGSSDPFTLHYLQTGQTIDEASYAHHFLDILHTGDDEIIELPFHFAIGKA